MVILVSVYRNRRCILMPIYTVCLVLSQPLAAYENVSGEFGLVVQAVSNWVYDGTTETRDEPSIGINGEWRIKPTVFLGFEAHEASTVAEQQRERSIAAYIGIDRTLGKGWYTALSLQHREFPGSEIEWDFTELIFQVAYQKNWSLKLDYSPDYYERDTAAYGAELDYVRNFNSQSYWSVQVGVQEQVDSQFIDYEFVRFGIGLSTGSFNIDLSYGWNSEDGNVLFGNELILSPELLLQLSYRIK